MPVKKKTEKNKKVMKVLEEEEEEEAELIDSEEDSVIDSATTTSIPESKPNIESKKSKLNKKRLLKEAEKADKRGVCYLSRIPPHMDHVNLRQILSQYADIQRIFLAPKDSSAQLPSKPSRRSQNTAFTEGWVEFTNKSVAKRVANMLNGEQMGGKKRSSFHYDLWNIKYLSKFKWDDLTDELAFKKAVRDQKLALELSAARRERDFYMSRVDQSRALNAIEERLKKKQKVDQNTVQMKKVVRHFPQTKPIAANAKESKPAVSDDLLDAVFGGS
ncbi:hypothetical protein TanjilG_06024 [Lupinus angustifolius]|uniref:Uncharacterized protein n=2 Tax=Lupinus angustifolius TaxID=3871 RepID=A0A4P1RJ38_LUPAN|nr:hypothetical protein TanjilG_06024 [Lupinus angustifolius]